MIGWICNTLFAKLGARYDYDVGYLRDLGEAYPALAWRYLLMSIFSAHYGSIPRDAYFAAKFRAALLSDCGPCSRLVARVGWESGMAKDQLIAVLEGASEAMNADTALGFRFAEATLGRNNAQDEIIREVEIGYGRRGLWDLSMAVAMGQFYPTLKSGLGARTACQPPRYLVREIADDWPD